jgi:D-inositol-3-phosphate glycosyltransferase
MRIAMISYHTCPLATLGGKDTGGMNVYVRDLSRFLGRAGIGVDVFTRSQDEHVPHVLHDLGYGNRVVHVPAGPEIPMEKDRLADYLPTFVDNILDFSARKRVDYDLVHSHYWLSGLATQELVKQWQVPFVQMFHTLGMMKDRVARSQDESASPFRIESERQLLRSADRVVAATQAELAQFQWLYKVETKNVRVIPPGVDITRFYPIPKDEAKEFVGIAPSDTMILFVGRIEPLKGIDTLLQAMAELKSAGKLQAHCRCLAVIGGDPPASKADPGEELVRLRAMVEELGMGDLVAFLGSRNQDTLPYYYSAAEVVVVPSHYESFGLVALEAMACGRPVVASETGGLAFLVRDGETGYHVPAADPGALAEKLGRLVGEPDLRRSMGQRAQVVAQGYAWPTIVESVVDLYEDVLAKEVVA